ncbi:MAG: arylesterase [Pseudomonadota bacterium]
MSRFKVYLLAFFAFFVFFQPLAAAAEPVKILAFGDSLTAGYGLSNGEAFPEKLEEKLRDKGYQVDVINAGISGETTSGGLNRLEWVLQNEPDIVMLGLGANDAMRFIDPKIVEQNLTQMLEILQDRDLDVLLLGMYAPRNSGPAYTKSFDAIYPRLAEQFNIAYYPFLLEGVAMDPDLNLKDRVHPNEKGTEVIADNLLPRVEKLLQNE